MDDDLTNLEAELTRLRPVSPSRALVECVGRDLAPAPRVQPLAPLRWVWFAVLPAAAAIAVVVLQYSQRPAEPGLPGRSAVTANATASPADAPLKPVAAENVLVSARDEGLVTLEDGTAARRQRLQFVDTITWRNPRTNSSLRWSVPREEVRIVPVVFQ
jgi:hypothetical protein